MLYDSLKKLNKYIKWKIKKLLDVDIYAIDFYNT